MRKKNLVLWTVAHYKEEFNLLVASREAADAFATNDAGGKKSPACQPALGQYPGAVPNHQTSTPGPYHHEKQPRCWRKSGPAKSSATSWAWT